MLSLILRSAISETKYIQEGETLRITGGEGDVLNSTVFEELFPLDKPRNFTKATVEGKFEYIPSKIFSGLTGLKEITIDAPIVNISSYAFANCESITTIELPQTVKNIGNLAFFECVELQKIFVPRGLTNIYKLAFSRCLKLEKFVFLDKQKDQSTPAESVLFGNESFKECTQLTTIAFPDNLHSIAFEAFNACPNLANFIVNEEEKNVLRFPSNITIKQYSFMACDSIKSINFDNVEYIGNSAFAACIGLESITWGSTITNIYGNAFSGCTSLKTVSQFSKPCFIHEYAFSNCKNLETFIFPDNVAQVPYACFAYCEKLNKIELKSVIELKGKAFAHTGFRTFQIPDETTSIATDTFEGCRFLREFKLSKENPNYYVDPKTGALLDKTSTTLLQFPQAHNIREVSVPDTVTKIVPEAFAYAQFIETVILPDSVSDVGRMAFVSCPLLKRVTLGNQTCVLNDRTFQNCTALESINLDYVTTATSQCFAYCRALKSAVFSDKLSNLGPEVFIGCSALAKIELGKSCHYIQDKAFAYCTSLESIVLPEVCKGVGFSLFSGCTSLKNVSLSKNLTSISPYAFSGCISLESIKLPETTKGLGAGAFNGCIKLKEIVIPKNVTEIRHDLFYNTSALERVTILGPKITKIADKAFAKSGIKELNINANVAEISSLAFSETKQEKINIVYCGNKIVTGSALSGDSFNKATVHVAKYYKANEFAGHAVVKDATACVDPDTGEHEYVTVKWWWILVGLLGAVVIGALIVIPIVICSLKKAGWKSKETLTESLLTQTV